MTRPRRPVLPATLSLALVGAGVVLTGCYTRTIRAEGIGSDRISTEEPYAEDWPFEPIGREIDRANSRPKGRPPSAGSGPHLHAP